MPTHQITTRLLALIALLAALALPARAQPVTPAELRREIETLQVENQSLANQVRALTEQLAALQAEHAAALDRARALEAENQLLREQGAQAPGPDQDAPSTESTEPPAPTQAPIPEDPLASPASMLAELQRRYQAAFAPPADPNLAPGSPGDGSAAAPQFTAALRRALEQWCAEQRTLRGPIEWRVRFTQLDDSNRLARTALLTVIDPASSLPIGHSTEVFVPREFYDTISREIGIAGGDPKAPLWTLRATFEARPHVEPDRPTAGVFAHPDFVGPYVQFRFDLNFEDVTLVGSTRAQHPSR